MIFLPNNVTFKSIAFCFFVLFFFVRLHSVEMEKYQLLKRAVTGKIRQHSEWIRVKRTYMKQQTSWISAWKTARTNRQGVSETGGNNETIERFYSTTNLARCISIAMDVLSRHSFAIHSWKLTRQWYQMFVNFPLTLLWWCIIWVSNFRLYIIYLSLNQWILFFALYAIAFIELFIGWHIWEKKYLRNSLRYAEE